MLAVLEYRLTGDQRCEISVDTLYQTPPTGGQVVHKVWCVQL